MKNVTLKQLRAFVTVAAECSFTLAAGKLHVTQSTLTSAIKALEDELGTPLFDRSTRSVVLTHQGELFLPAARRILRDLNDSLGDLQMMTARERGSVSVCGAGSFIRYVLSPALAVLATDYPHIHVRLTEGTTRSVTPMVLSGEADFGVATLFEPIAELDTAPLLNDAFGVICSTAHPLGDGPAPLTWSALARHRAIQLNEGNGIRALLDREARIAGLFSSTVYEVSGVASLQTLLNQGFGYSALPALAAKSLLNEKLCFRPLSRPGIRRELHVVKKKGRSLSPAAMALFRCMVQALDAMPPDKAINVAATGRATKSFCGT